MKILGISYAFLLLLVTATGHALPESQVFEVVKKNLIEQKKCSKVSDSTRDYWQRHVVETPLEVDEDGRVIGKKTYRLRFSQFGCGIGQRGSLVIAPGRGESSVEYFETAMDYQAMGFSPIYVIDHRGQGFSPRLLVDKSKAHINNFTNYIVDFHYATKAIELLLINNEGRKPYQNPLYYTSNSMGGAIGIGYLQYLGFHGLKNPYKKMALISPMVKVNYISFVDKRPTFFNKKLYSESGAFLQANLRCWFGICNQYAAEKTFGAYVKGKRKFKPDFELSMTHSRSRYELRDFVWDHYDWTKIKNTEYKGENWDGPHVGGSTNAWVLHNIRFLRRMRDAKYIKKMDPGQILMVLGTRDLRAYEEYMDKAPDLKNHESFCKKINEVQGQKQCQFVAIKGAFHEIYKENDMYRAKGFALVDRFFKDSN